MFGPVTGGISHDFAGETGEADLVCGSDGPAAALADLAGSDAGSAPDHLT